MVFLFESLLITCYRFPRTIRMTWDFEKSFLCASKNARRHARHEVGGDAGVCGEPNWLGFGSAVSSAGGTLLGSRPLDNLVGDTSHTEAVCS